MISKARKIFLTPDEITFLLDYIGEEAIFGVKQSSIKTITQGHLITKGILNEAGEIQLKTVALVELLRMYKHATYYLRFQNYIFALQEDGKCIITEFKESDEGYSYYFMLGINMQAFEIMILHPIVAQAVSKHKNLTDEMKQISEKYINRELEAILIAEYFNAEGELIDKIGYLQKDKKLYELNENVEIKQEITENNSGTWLLEKLAISEKQIRTIQETLKMTEGSVAYESRNKSEL